MKNLFMSKSKRKYTKKFLCILLALVMFFTGIGMENYAQAVQAATAYTTLYLVDDTPERWLGNDNAVMELVDNTYGHDHYIMTKENSTTWSVKVPETTYNVTFNRLSPDRNTQWNSWSAGGRDGHSTYHAITHEHGYWDGTAVPVECFHEGDVIYLDYYEFADWEISDALFYVNFTDASKKDNNGADIELGSADIDKYNPILLSDEIEEQVYTYTVTAEDEGATELRFWRGNSSTLWNCSVTLTYSDYKAGNNCVKVQGWNDTGYVCPYVPRRHITQIDSIELDISGNRKVNRKIDIDLDIEGETELLLTDETVITITKLDSNGEVMDSVEENYLAYDEGASAWNHRELIFKKSGTYNILAVATDGTDSFQTEEVVVIADDQAPVAGIRLGDDDKTLYLRDDAGAAHIDIQDISVSEINDDIVKRFYTIYHDSNNDGEYTQDEIVETIDGNEISVKLDLNAVGNYLIKLYVKESFTDTIESLLDDDAYLSAEVFREFEITNQAPASSISMSKSRIADIIFTVGNADSSVLAAYAAATEGVRQKLEELEIEANVSTVSTSALTAQDTFAWTEYDHYNYVDRYLPTLDKHIIYDGKDIKMVGYSYAALKDFLYVEDNDSSRKIFEFDLQRDADDWHSMEGGGFLFNTIVSDEENYIQGYCILVTQSGLKLVQINKTNLERFRNGTYNMVQSAGKLLQTFPMTDLYAEHHLKIITDGNILTVYDGDSLLVDEYVLPDDDVDAYGYGPIISHVGHACSQQSYFTFKNIIMQTVTGESLSDVVNNHEWTPGTNHYVINLSETSVPELSDSDRMSDVASALISNDAMFFGVGNDVTMDQYNGLLNVIDEAGENIRLDRESDSDSGETEDGESHRQDSQEEAVSVDDAIDQIVSRITADINSKDYSIGYTLSTDEKVEYSGTYTDPENDPVGIEEWNYLYDATVFGGSGEDIRSLTYSEPITMFINPGAYTITHRVSDDPAGGNEALAPYAKWSDTDEYTKLILSQHRPVAEITASVTQSPDDSSVCLVNVQYSSYDEDHPDDAEKGIRDEKFYYRELGQSEWTEGRFPANVQMGTTYLVKYIVTDIEGTESRPAVIAIKTNDAREYVEPDDNNPPEVSLVVSDTTVEIGSMFYVEASAQDDYGVVSFSVNNGDEQIATSYGRFECNASTAGEYTITATATDIGGNVTTESQTVRVIDKSDVTPPTIEITSPGNGAVSGKTDIVGTIRDNKQLKSYTVTLTKALTETDDEVSGEGGQDDAAADAAESMSESSDTGAVVIASGTEEIIDDVIAVIDTDELSAGVYKIEITAEDMAGLTAGVIMLITVSENEYDRIPPQAQITDIVLDCDNAVISVIGTIMDENEIAGYELYLCGENDTGKILIASGKSQIEDAEIGIISTDDIDEGTYTLTLSAWDGEGNICENTARFTYTKGTGSDEGNDEKIDVSEDLDAPVILTSLDAAVTSEGLKLSISGTIDDENLAAYTVITGKANDAGVPEAYHTVAEGTENVIDSIIAEYTYTEYEHGDYIVAITASDAAGNMRTVSYTVTVKENGTIDDGYRGEDDETLNLILSKTTANAGETVTAYMTYPSNVSDVSLTAGNAKVIISGRRAQITADSAGEVTVTLSVTIEGEIRSVSQNIRFYDASDTEYPTGYFLTPQSEDEISTVTEVKGTAADETKLAYYTLEYRMEGTDEYRQIAYGEESVTDGVLGTLDTTLLENGRYLLRLTVVDAGGNRIRAERAVNVTGNLKVGNMNIGFTDIISNVSGIPLSVTRNYSSMNKASGDFGTGWTLGLQSAKLIESSDITQGYSRIQQGTMFSTGYYMVQTQCHDITVTYGDGTSDRFELNLSPERQALIPIYEVSVSFTCVTDKNVKLELDGDNTALVYGSQLVFADFDIGGAHSYVLTRKDGTRLYLNTEYGLLKMEDTNGNTVSITKSGYKHSSGNSVEFTRDEQGHIVKAQEINSSGDVITSVTYAYDSRDNLIAVTDNADRTVMFTYDDDHNMIDIIDPSGTAVARNIYDDDGRLVATVDADGNRIEYEHDVEGRTEVVRDKLGNPTVYTYDDNGNILKMVDALGNVTTSTYDDDNNVLTKTDALGNVTSYEYDGNGNVISATSADGIKVECNYTNENLVSGVKIADKIVVGMEYDSNRRVSSIEDGNGNVTEYSYTPEGELTGITDSIGEYKKITYDQDGNVSAIINGEGESETYTYDSSGRCISVTVSRIEDGEMYALTRYYTYDNAGNVVQSVDNEGNVTCYEYDINGRQTASVDAAGRRISYDYDARGYMTRITYDDGTYETFSYDANGNNITAVGRNGLTVSMVYDKLNRLIQKVYMDGTSEQYKYDAVGNVIEVTGSNGEITSYAYNDRNLNTSITDAYGNVIGFTYDSYGRLTARTDAAGNTVYYYYDDNGNIIKTTFADGNSVTSSYDARNRIICQKDQNGNETTYEYDRADRLIKVNDPYGNSYLYDYDTTGNLTCVTDAEGNVTNYLYDGTGRIRSVKNALGRTMVYEYDAIGNLTSFTDYAGTVTSYEYDSMNRITEKRIGTNVVRYLYDDTGLLSKVIDAEGNIISYEYDSYDRLTAKTVMDGVTLTYTYDEAGRIKTFNNGFGNTTYEYDRLNRITRVIDHNGQATVYEYDELGNRSAVRYPNGTVMTYTYDACQRLKEECVTDKNGVQLAKYTYGLGKAGERLSVTETDSSNETVITYEYDKLERLVKETIIRDENQLVNEYTYDKVGNRLTKTATVTGDIEEIADIYRDEVTVAEGTTTYTYNELNQLTEESSSLGSITYLYDYNGNLLRQTGAKNISYSYDLENHLTGVTVQSSDGIVTETYSYDYEGNRTSKTINGTDTTYYITDTSGSISSLSQVVAEVDESGQCTALYTRGEELLSMERGSDIYYYQYDGQGSVRIITDDNGQVTDRYTYDAFGNLLESDGDTENDFMYVGEQFNENTGLYYLRARYMNPSAGTFISMDSYTGNIYDAVSLHKYMYANANPVMYTDPSGYMAIAATYMSISLNISAAQMQYDAAMISIGLGLLATLRNTIAIYNATVMLNESIDVIINNGIVFESADDVVDEVKAQTETSQNDKKNRSYVVYTLVDSENIVRYVGRTCDYERRMTEHDQPGGKMYEYHLQRGETFDNLTKEEARGLEQSLIVLYHTQNFAKDNGVKFYNFINGVGIKNKNGQTYYDSAVKYMNKYPSMFENFVEEELNALKESISYWW